MIDTRPSSIEFVMQIAALLTAAGLQPDVLSIKNCTQGRNNRTYRIQTADGAFIIKQYLCQTGDLRDRLAAEFAFLTYAVTVAPKQVPKPFYQDPQMSMALYELIEGQPLLPQDVTANEVAQAADFFCALNQSEQRAKAKALPKASEACFSIQEHFQLISARIQQLEKMLPETVEDHEARLLILRLSAYWRGLMVEVARAAQSAGVDLNVELKTGQRCISPSDFGFHNALKLADGQLCFLDFEYAGWDDPAKMTGDFFSQLALPVPPELFDSFVATVMQPFVNAQQLVFRAKLLRLVYRVKWCCIALNIFLPVHLARYRFANPSLNVAELKRTQVNKVNRLIQSLETQAYGLP